MAHARRGRLNLANDYMANPIKTGPAKMALNGGAIAKKPVTRATLKSVDLNPKVSQTGSSQRKVESKKISKALPRQNDCMQVDKAIEAFANLDVLPAGVTDVDCEDSNDPQMCADNVRAIYIYLRHLERVQPIKEDFLRGSGINAKMRAVLVNWLAEVHEQFKLLQETLYLTVAILDRFLSHDALRVKRQKLQLIGVSAMFIASKYEEMFNPEIGDFVYITDNSCSPSEIRAMEMEILKALNFDLGRPLSIHFLRRNSKAGDVAAEHHNFAKMTLEVAFTEYRLAHVLPSKVAAAALMLALRVLNNDRDYSAWGQNLAFYSGYDTASLLSTCQDLSTVLLSMSTSKYQTIYLKYSQKSKLSVSKAVATKYRKSLELISQGV